MSQTEQLNYILNALCGGVKAEMQRRLGMSAPTTLQGWFSRGSFDARRIYAAFPELNPMWLLTGEGIPHKGDCRQYDIPVLDDEVIDPKPNEMTDAEKIDSMVNALCGGNQTTFYKRCGVAEATPSNWKKRNNMNYRIVSKGFPEVSLMWLIHGQGPMLLADLESNPQPPISSSPYPDIEQTPCYKVAEGEPVDRALLNMLLHEKSVLEARIATLETRNLELEKLNTRLETRLEGAAGWFYEAIAQHPDLKPESNKKG